MAAAALVSSWMLPFLPTALAQTAGGTSISNTATATYQDPNDPNTTLESSSNTVVIEVAEVAGIVVDPAGTELTLDANGDGLINTGDQVAFDFTITNIGNDPTRFRIPGSATVTGPGTQTGGIEITDPDAAPTTVTIPAGGEYITVDGSIQPGESIPARVIVTVNGATGNIAVTLGQTDPPDQDNLARTVNGGDVFTVDGSDGIGGTPIPEVAGAPINGTREASDTQSVTINAAPQAFTTLEKTRTNVDDQGDTINTNDVLTYQLDLTVEGQPPVGSTGFAATSLQPTEVDLDASNSVSAGDIIRIDTNGDGTGDLNQDVILVSDVIPSATRLTVAADPGHVAPAAPSPDWTTIYVYDAAPGITVPVNTDPLATPLEEIWTETAPTTAAEADAVKRIGWYRTTAIAAGTTEAGFTFSVVTTGADALNPTIIQNIGQVFGQTTTDPDGPLVYDESGDQNPSNFNDNGTPGDDSQQTIDQFNDDANADGPDQFHNGVPDQTQQDADNNTNSGTGEGGEVNVLTLAPPGALGVLSGPINAPGATGPTDNNDDFTDKPAAVLTGVDTPAADDVTDPGPVTFTNTVENTSGAATAINLVPSPSTDPALADLPDGTLVTISTTEGSATWEYDAGTNTWIPQGPDSVATAILQPGETADFGVEIDLPANTELSTDRLEDDNDGDLGYPVELIAFIDSNADGNFDDGTEPSNITIDRVYVGFLNLLKESRVLQNTGPAVQGTDGTFSTTDKTAAPGNRIEYRVTYTNIAANAPTGSGSIDLEAVNVVIDENGTANGNTWALDQDPAGAPGAGIIDTSHVINTGSESGGAQVNFFSGATGANLLANEQSGDTADQDVSRYQVDLGATRIGPGESRSLSFQREVN